MIEEIKSIEKIEDSNNLKEIINILIKEVNKLDVELKDLKKISEDKIEEKEVNCLDKLDEKEEITEVQNEKIEEVKIEKMNINKFVEAFPEYIKIEAFSEEMENEEMIGKLIEIFKSIFGAKDKKIEEKEKELENKNEEYIKEKEELEKNLKKLDETIKEKEKDLENKNKEYEEEKEKLEKNLKELNEKIEEKEKELENKNEEYIKEKEELEKNLKKLDETIKEKEKDLENKNKEYEEEKEKLEKNLKELNEKIEEKEKELENKNEEYIKVKKERDSMGDLLEARQLYNSYLEMEETIKSKFKNILFQKDFESFISSGYSISTIDNIWDIVKIEYKNISSENLDKLRKIFKFFITQINKRFENPTYGLIEARLEEDFDPVTQFDLSQNSSGKIIEFIFYGYGTLEDKSSSDDKDIIDKIRKRPLVLTK